jgi:subtilisin family serine protease
MQHARAATKGGIDMVISARRVSCAVVALCALVLTAGAGGSIPVALPDRYIVVLHDHVLDAPAIAAEHAQRFGLGIQHVYEHALKGYATAIPAGLVAAVQSDPRVAFVSEDRLLHAIGTRPIAPGDTAPTGVRRIAAASTTTAHDASDVGVAVIDTGIDLLHPDLDAVSGTNCITPGLPAQDDHGHGTHVAGTIAARNNGAGVIGVAPGTRVYAVKVLSAAGIGLTSQIICGIDWVTQRAAALNIKVANMSLGGAGANDGACGSRNGDAMHRAICSSVAAGVTYVVAAGNDGENLAGAVPAAYPEVLTVTAMADSDGAPGGAGGAPACRTGERDDTYATFSNFAIAPTETSHTIAGPGVCISSTWLGGLYLTLSGTSMAAPHVSGVAALCIGHGGVSGPCAGRTPAQIIQKLRADAADHASADAGYGFTGDPDHPVTSGGRRRPRTLYFGFLTWAGGY